MNCPRNGVHCHSSACNESCQIERDQAEKLKAKSEQQWQTIIKRIEQLPDAQQEKIIECGMRLRELACFYGPYFPQALMLTSAEIGAGRLIMPKVANCDQAPGLMLPGLQSADAVRNPKIIVPGAKGNS